MALTQEQIERMDAIVGIAPTQENNLEQKNINLSDDEFKKMDEIIGLKPLEDIQQTQPTQEIDEIEEEIKRKNPDDYANWKSKEPISAYNAAKNAAREFNGTYDNIDENANLNWFENFLKNSEWSKNRSASVDSKIAQEKEKNEQREQRINEGSATLGDKISNAFKNAAQSNIQDAQQKAQINKVAQGVNEADKTSRYEVSGVAKGGQPIYREVDLLEQIGFLEGMQKNLSKNIPVIGALADGADNKKQREIKDKILKGEPIRQDELNYLNYATKRKQEEYVRGYSTAGQIGQGTIDSLGISADILLGSGLASALKIGSVATRAANVSGKLAPVVEWGVNSLAGAGAGLLANPQRIYANYQERMIGNEMKVTDSGMMIFQESEEKPATALIKSMMGTYLMYFTELGGGQLLKGIGSGIAKGANAIVNKVDGGRSATVMAKLMEKNPKLKNFLDKTTSELSKRYEQLKGMPVVGKSTGWIKDKAHFDGFLEEMGEEALEDVLNLTFGVNNEERSLENYIDAVFKSPEEWAIIAGTIAITGAGLSATSYFLGEKMAEAGATQQDIEDVLLNTTENQKKELISEQMQNENIDIVESAKYQIQNRDYNLELDNKQIEVENTVYNKLLKGNVQKDVALANAKLISNAFRNKSAEAQEVFLKNLERLDVEYNIPAEQRENEVYQQVAKDFVGIAGANENEVEDAQREWQEKGTKSKYFKRYSNNSQLINSNDEALKHDFKTGEKITVKAHHGTKRKDRIGSVFLPERSTSGPMAFFSSNREVSEGYAKNKEDTSLSNEINSYYDWFKFQHKGKEYSLNELWVKLPLSKRNEIAKKAGQVTLDWDTEEVIINPEEKSGLGNFDYNLKYKRGNAIEALVEEWINSGHLLGDEIEFLKVLELAGVEGVYFNDPNKTDAGVYDVYIAMKNPLVTSDIPKEVLNKLQEESKKQPEPLGGYGADPWNKNTKDPVHWINTLTEDYKNKENSHVWTSIPDWVTNVLKEFGYDGIIDTGGKSGGEIHKVYIPFYSEQIKSVDNRGTFDAENPNIYYQNVMLDLADVGYRWLLKGTGFSIKEMLRDENLEHLEPYFEDVLDVKFGKMTKRQEKTGKWGEYSHLDKKIYYNASKLAKMENHEQIKRHIFLHELMHAKIRNLYDFANEELKKENLSEEVRGIYEDFTDVVKESIDAANKYNNYIGKYPKDKLDELDDKKRKKVVGKIKQLYNEYKYSAVEADVDNVAFVISEDIKTQNPIYLQYKRFLESQNRGNVFLPRRLRGINEFLQRHNEGFSTGFRVEDIIGKKNFYFQAAKTPVQDEKNLIMTHSAKIENLDDILANDTLIAPSMAITNKNQDVLNDFGFGDLIFIRKPDRIDFKTDNIYDRDIYSPRMPRPSYKTKRHGTVSTYDYDDMKRQAERNPERFEEVYGESFEEYFEGAEKVLFLGYSPSGNRRYAKYNAENIIKAMKKEGVVGGEHWGYGLNSFLAQLAKKQKNLKQLKKSSVELGKVELEVIEKLKKEYSDYENELRSYAKADYKSFTYFNDIYPDVLKAIYNNNSYEINEYLDVEKIKAEAPELINNVKEFINTAAKTNRTYFEAKPMREVVLDEFSDVLVRENSLTDEQKRKLEKYGIAVTEYKNSNEISDVINKIGQKKPQIYFQSAYHGTRVRGIEKTGFDLSYALSGEGAMAHGYGVYLAEDKNISDENYRKRLIQDNTEWLYDGQPIKENVVEYMRAQAMGKEALIASYEKEIKKLEEKAKETQVEDDEISRQIFGDFAPDFNKANINRFKNKIKLVESIDISKIEKREEVGQLYEVDIPENDVLLDEDKTFSEQPQKVQEIILKLAEEQYKNLSLIQFKNIIEFENINLEETFGTKYANQAFDKFKQNTKDYLSTIIQNKTGRDIYQRFSKYFGSPREASLKLNEYGIKGITYDGRQDGRCYVIFDDKAIKVLNTFYQETEQNNLIAGYTPLEVMTKSQELYEKLGDMENPVSEEEAAKILANAHILQDAIDANANKDNYTPEQLEDLFLNAYYVMNDQEIPAEILEEEVNSQRTYADYKDIHNKRKEQQEETYRGYFMEGQDKDLITIMSNQDASTALHELGHWYLNALNEMAKVDEASRKQLDEVDKWLGRSGDYTVSQQEKFARSFEAYLYKGKAPNSYLKEVFENFKQWLKSVYAHITEIEGLGADISKEVEEMFDRMFSNDEYYQERKQANELLKKAKKESRKQKAKNNTIRDDKELDEVEKRHKEVSYQILSAATGKSVKYLKTIFETTSENETHAKKREAIINSLDSVEDSIKISGGMREEWKEFYSDTGVDYETSESGADYELASKALDTILNKSYKNISKDYESEMSDRAEYFENLIKDAEREYKILLNSYKKENRNVALAAIYDWMDSLDSTIKEDFEQKFIYDSRIIERNEHLDKFDKAKRKIIAKALEVENRYGINKDEKYKEVVVEIMKNLNFLQAEDKARLTTNILDINGVDSLMGRIDSIMDIAKTMEDVNYRRVLQREIHKELQGTKNIKKGPRTVGKYDYRTNKLFEELRELDKLTPEKANEKRLDMQKLTSAEDNGLNYRQKLINKFLSYKANGMIYADTDLMKEIYDEIVRIKLAGKTAKDEVDLQEKLDESKEIERLVEIVKSKNKDKKKGKANIIIRGYIDGFGNLESTLNGIFNKKVADEYGAEILYAETQADVMQYEIKDKFENEVAKIYDLPKWDWDRQIIKYLGEKYTFQENRRKYDPETFELTKSLTVGKEMTKMDLILAYMWSMNPTLNKRLINMFGEAQLENMFDELSLQDVKFAELMLRTAQSTYPQANKAYIKKYGLDLPKVTAYFPSKVERGTEIDLFNDYSSKSLNNAFTKSRANSELVPMEFSNPVQILYNHIDGVSKFVYMGENLDKMNLVLNNQEFLKPVIIEKFGNDVYKTLKQAMLNCTYKTDSKVYNGIQKIFDYLSSNWIVANISTRPIVALKQLLSANNYATEMPVMEWTNGFIKSVLDYKNTIDYMMKIPYVKARLGGSMQNEFLKQYINNSAFARTKKIKDFLAMNVKLGDAGSLIFGGKPYIDYLISQGVSEAEAVKQFVLQTNRTQQSSAISSMSNFQVSASKQPLTRVFTAYRNAQAQYLRKCADAIIAYSNGDIELKQCAKTVYHYMFLQPFLFNVATSGSLMIWATSGDDEEFWADFKLSLMNLCMDSVGMLAELYSFVIRRLVEGEKYRPVTTPLWGDIQKEITRIAKEDASFEEFVKGFGYLFGNIGTGVPVPAIVNMGEGVKELVTDDFLKGLFKILGYSDSRAKKMSGN